jgi:hypothetical protein
MRLRAQSLRNLRNVHVICAVDQLNTYDVLDQPTTWCSPAVALRLSSLVRPRAAKLRVGNVSRVTTLHDENRRRDCEDH